MRIPRIYHPAPLAGLQQVTLSDDASHHVGRVLRMQPGQSLELFDGSDVRFAATILHVSKKSVQVEINDSITDSRESSLEIHLVQGISKGDRMDFVLQKSVELGVTSITPVFTQRCNVKLNQERLARKQDQWRKIVLGACEQSGRNWVPQVRDALALPQWLQNADTSQRVILDPYAQTRFRDIPRSAAYTLIIGPEGGFTDDEVQLLSDHQCLGVQIGPRVLRTETAALAAITALQSHFGDF
ncbi:16S rRNA (uracil(1498)-N(3))-methyltransferase [Aliidiomarina halalkaliphila]|uniref:Ribosomal RNA small subunit methyltransferase E n=1 Tax=Aliidiomarina halalkaliphila TaxID=2593535 RepID=A0A552WZ89_9GAMM|nr:16S rRNA (uracil(1498)-N(3))-methyltransferase [Aliidiomarina halalkaliphila]TRW48141.1 16S rRNA (uracil(1498)-N(3))-methyltransferase [Aliidiomarina halalkaliphila]